MGNTIRRQPITSKIPASPNYRFLNITDFKGLDISDNPFILKPNTASDLLNVYVDENNALTTRPRLEKTHDMSSVTDGTTIIGVYNITNGLLIHTKTSSDTYRLHRYFDSGETLEVSGTIPTQKCSVFEHGESIYLLDTTNYYVVNNITISQVKPYVPTTSRGGTSTTKGSSGELFNVLTDDYKETYYWNVFETPYTTNSDIVSAKNTTYYEKDFTAKTKDHEIIAYKNGRFVSRNKTTGDFYLGRLSDDKQDIILAPTGYSMSGDKLVYVDNELVFCDITLDDASKPSYKYYAEGDALLRKEIGAHIESTSNRMSISSDGKFLFVRYEPGHIVCWSLDDNKNMSILTGTKDGDFVTADIIDGDLYVCGSSSRLYRLENFVFEADKEKTAVEVANVGGTSYDGGTYLDKIKKYKKGIYCYNSSHGRGGYWNKETDEVVTNNPSTDIWRTQVSSRGMVGFAYYRDYLVNTFINNDLFYNTNSGLRLYDVSRVANRGLIYDEKSDTFLVEKTNGGISILFKTDETEPLLEITKRFKPGDNRYEELVKFRETFLKSFLTKRFENNWWFASGNTLFRSENNDPTYIPIDEEYSLGDTKDHITGFNMAQDDLLLVYKKKNIFAIQPVEVYERATYSVLETKNVSGNNAIGSPIVTTLNEIPVHISYDGIFALNQLKNVQSSDRISVLISDNINKEWLKEKKEAVDSCQTINRLYWTYFVLKYEDLTKVYLLDNRTSSWFYWELPITTINVFVKDETTMFVDNNGCVYKLTTDDIINEYNKEVTEYYDHDKKLIKWFWKTQILPLGTINYSKKLVDTTFIVADTDASDEYALNYKFRAYRKLVSESTETTISNRLNYVQSTTKKTLIPRFNFLQLEISNVEDDLNNNKLRLLGLGLKYVLLDGLL